MGAPSAPKHGSGMRAASTVSPRFSQARWRCFPRRTTIAAPATGRWKRRRTRSGGP